MPVKIMFWTDYVKLHTIADIPLGKTKLRQYCTQVGASPQIDQRHTTYVPRVFETHLTALKKGLITQQDSG